MSRSPNRYSFHERNHQRKLEKAESPESVQAANDMLELFKTWQQRDLELEESDEWKMNNMSYDLCTNDWILAKVRASESYAQNLYAAMCNNRFQKLDTWPILKDEYWSCTWRSAGGIIADMRQEGDYIDWYCSGIAGGDEPDTYLEGHDLKRKSYVPESVVTEEIEQDLNKLGWKVIKDDESL